MNTIISLKALPSHGDRAICERLQTLIQDNLDAAEAFHQAAEGAWDSELRGAFCNRAAERENFARQLQAEQRAHGQRHPDEDISISGALHRAWTCLKTALGHQDDQVLVEELAKMEARSVNDYAEALEEANAWPAELRTLLSAQAIAVRQAYHELQEWADTRRYLRID